MFISNVIVWIFNNYSLSCLFANECAGFAIFHDLVYDLLFIREPNLHNNTLRG